MDVIEKLVVGGDQFFLDPGKKRRPRERWEDGTRRGIKLPVKDVLAKAAEVFLLERGVNDEGRDDFHPVSPDNFQRLLVVLDGVVLVQLAEGVLVDFLKPDKKFPKTGFFQEGDDLWMLDDGIAADLAGKTLPDPVSKDKFSDAFGPGHAEKEIIIRQEYVLGLDGLDFR